MKKVLLILISGVITLSSCSFNKGDSTNDKPNIIFILTDDLGYHDLSITGSNIYQTPNIDNLAKESVFFSQAYANYPRCVPSRYATWTASYPVQDGDVPDDGFVLSNIPDSKNIVKQITKTGYQTAFFGKWHLGGDDSNTGPKGFGFEYSLGAGHAGSPISFFYPYNTPKGRNKNVKKSPIVDLEELSKEGDYLTDVITDQVIKYISNRDEEKPFMAVLAYYAVHQPIEGKIELTKQNQEEINKHNFGDTPEYILEGTGRTKMRQNHAGYAALVENTDMNVGRLLNYLKEQGLEDNTIVIFSSDHGGLSNDGYNKRNLATSNYPLRAGKGWLYDGGIKVPLLIKWKDKFIPYENNSSTVMLMDVLPTLLEISSEKSFDVDGRSLVPILKQEANWDERTVFWHSSKARPKNTGDTKSSAVRKGNYKLINWYEEDRYELYNISKDPGETTNLHDSLSVKAQELASELKTWKEKHSIK